MDFNQWVQDEHSNLETFAIYWAENNRSNPEMFPLEMPAGEWDEQYRLWQS